MNNNKSNLLYRESVIKYASKHGVSKTSRKYNVSRSFVYKWKSRYDGSLDSLCELSRKPHHSPRESSTEEYDLIKRYVKRNPRVSLVELWVKLRRVGYSRNITTLYRCLIRLDLKITAPTAKPKYKPKTYEACTYPGQKVQIDVKQVPSTSLTSSIRASKLYQFTCIDEYSRYRYLEIFDDKSTYSAYKFIINCIKFMPFVIECVQTDNGLEFTNRLIADTNTLTLMEQHLKDTGIRHKLIKPYTPRHNGKVERSHRKDGERFYSRNVFLSIDDARRKLKTYNREYNNFPMKPLGWLSPKEYLELYYINRD